MDDVPIDARLITHLVHAKGCAPSQNPGGSGTDVGTSSGSAVLRFHLYFDAIVERLDDNLYDLDRGAQREAVLKELWLGITDHLPCTLDWLKGIVLWATDTATYHRRWDGQLVRIGPELEEPEPVWAYVSTSDIVIQGEWLDIWGTCVPYGGARLLRASSRDGELLRPATAEAEHEALLRASERPSEPTSAT